MALLVAPNDGLAEKEFTPFMGYGADSLCSYCNYHKKRPGAGKPFSFFRKREGICKQKGWRLRTEDSVEKLLDQAWLPGRRDKEDFMQKNGLRIKKVRSVCCWPSHRVCLLPLQPLHSTHTCRVTYEHTRRVTCRNAYIHAALHAASHRASQRWYAVHRKYIPRFNLMTMKPHDLMHLEDDGNMMYHIYWFINLFVRFRPQVPGFTLAAVNEALRTARPHVWADGRPPPPLHASMEKTEKRLCADGVKRLRPVRGGKAKYTAAQVRKFVLARRAR